MITRWIVRDGDRELLKKLKVDSAKVEDDFYDYSKIVVKKPWGYEYLFFSNQSIAVWILYLRRGAQTVVFLGIHIHSRTARLRHNECRFGCIIMAFIVLHTT